MRVLVNKQEKSFYSTFFPFIVSLSFAMAAPQCFSRRPRLRSGKNIIFPIFFTRIPVEAREHDDEEGRHVEEEKAREEGAQPGECEEG